MLTISHASSSLAWPSTSLSANHPNPIGNLLHPSYTFHHKTLSLITSRKAHLTHAAYAIIWVRTGDHTICIKNIIHQFTVVGVIAVASCVASSSSLFFSCFFLQCITDSMVICSVCVVYYRCYVHVAVVHLKKLPIYQHSDETIVRISSISMICSGCKCIVWPEANGEC